MDTADLPPSPTIPSTEDVLPASPPAKSRLPAIILSLVLLIFLGAASYFFYQYYALNRPINLPLVNQSLVPPSPSAPSASPLSVSVANPIPNASRYAVFTRFLDSIGQTQVNVLIDPATAEEFELNLPTGAVAHKWLSSPLLFYADPSRNGQIFIRNLEEGTERIFTPLTLPDPNIQINYTFIGYDALSPDGRWLIFGVEFTIPCPEPSPMDPNFQGGYGPCEPAMSLDHPSGTYLYALESGELSFLTKDFYRISGWDMSEHKLYFSEGSTTKAVNLRDRTIDFIDHSPYFGYHTLPLTGEYKMLKFEASTGDSGQSAFGKLDLINQDNTVATTIDSVAAWAFMQPFMTVSPDQKIVLFEKSYLDSSSTMRNYIMKYDLEKQVLTRLIPETDTRSFHLRGQWLDNIHYLIKASSFDLPRGTLNSDLVIVNASTGETKPLTTSRNIFFFNSN